MEKRLPHRHCGGKISDKPSFASTLLDSVYRSIDQNESKSSPSRNHDTRMLDPSFPSSITSRNQITTTQPEKQKNSRNQITTTQPEKQKNVAVSQKVILRHRAYTYPTPSSSESSSYGGVTSFDTETIFLPKIGTTAPTTWLGPMPEKKKSKTCSIKSKLPELRRTRTPVSPGARLANFVNSLFTASARKATKKTVSSPDSRSYLTKTWSLRERPLPAGVLKRSVRFEPVSDKCLYKGGVAGGPLDQERKMEDTVEDLLRRFKDDNNDGKDESDSSSDLFELQNLNAGTEEGGGYRDEFLVFETANLGALRARSLRF